MPETTFPIGLPVEKVGGDYFFSGWIVAAFRKRSGVERYVVEDDRGVLHVYSAKNLRPASPLAGAASAKADCGEVTDPVERERAACAYIARCHTGLMDGKTAYAISRAIKTRHASGTDYCLVTREAWVAVLPVWLCLQHGVPLPPEFADRLVYEKTAR